MKPTLIKPICNELSLYQYNEIAVLELDHPIGTAKIALQGAHLFSWKPAHCQQDVFWLSEMEPFKRGSAIRGGVPICFPWFGNNGTPAHGFARISLWDVTDYDIQPNKVTLTFSLFATDKTPIAQINMIFTAQCELIFTNYQQENAQLALHSYFNVGDIEQIQLHNLPTTTFNSLTQQQENVPSPRTIGENVDCIYATENGATFIEDQINQRTIIVEHINASDIVVWNPWHKPTSSMSDIGYKTMVCVESARIKQPLKQESVGVKIQIKNTAV
ncbi:D-hexose-6-phosphate mutarotase [Lonepinella koalarum]|uniref:D-hexose-6-phosphate mutarotase n=1 Tax=Lonepinella koalarum TaxID=53417 RepID=UPI0011E49E89|nr:D-hexose-6-phosphate mutarotase [Lonepinella koalarum]TYG33382.1 D-hexose-6-phosphate mutarotase [Lonepinella koalarum]